MRNSPRRPSCKSVTGERSDNTGVDLYQSGLTLWLGKERATSLSTSSNGSLRGFILLVCFVLLLYFKQRFLFTCFLFVFRKKYGGIAGMFECGASDTNLVLSFSLWRKLFGGDHIF